MLTFIVRKARCPARANNAAPPSSYFRETANIISPLTLTRSSKNLTWFINYYQ